MKDDKNIHLLTLACMIATVNAAHILGIFPLVAKSHFSCNHAILKSLHTAGHKITMITPFPPERKIENFSYILAPTSNYSFVGQFGIEKLTSMTLHSALRQFRYMGTELCDNILKMTEIQDALRSSEKLYDVLLAEHLSDFHCYLLIAEKLGIPIIATMTLRGSEEADNAIGVFSNPAVIPTYIWSHSVEMSMVERMENLWNNFLLKYYANDALGSIEEVYRNHMNFTGEFPSRKKVALVFYNNHASLLSRLHVPNAIDIGGIHVTTAQPLPQDIQKFIHQAPHGVILCTFGTTANSSTMQIEQREAFLSAFASVPQRVIWKYETPIENLPENVMISSWLPQRDILEHKNVIAFMSHCGLGGVYEAIMTGTPVVTIPLFADQPSNAAFLHYRGVGVNLDLKTATKDSILTALNTIINDTKYYDRMQEFSRIFKDRPMTPQETVVYWTEYVIRHNGASYLRALGTDMPFYKYFMLDIVAIVLSVTSIVVYVIYSTVKKLYRLITTRNSENLSKVKKND